MMTATAALAVLRKINYKRVGTISAVLVMFSILFSMTLVPKLLMSQLKKVRRCRAAIFWKLIFT